jgi:hypothetical protein
MANIAKIEAVKNGNIEFALVAGAASQTIAVGKDERMAIVVTNGSAAPITATIKKGTGICSVDGDLPVTVAAGESQLIGPLESARFADAGIITMTLSDATSVTIGVIQL